MQYDAPTALVRHLRHVSHFYVNIHRPAIVKLEIQRDLLVIFVSRIRNHVDNVFFFLGLGHNHSQNLKLHDQDLPYSCKEFRSHHTLHTSKEHKLSRARVRSI